MWIKVIRCAKVDILAALTKCIFILRLGRGDIVELFREAPRHIPALDLSYEAFVHDQACHLPHEVS